MSAPRSSLLRVAVVMGAAGAALAGVVWATGGVYTQTAHGDAATGVYRRLDEARGDCGQCHEMHDSRDGTTGFGPFPYALFEANDNQLCSTAGGAAGCHANPGAAGIYPGITLFEQSTHETDPLMVWPGPAPRARAAGDAGYCVNCHTAHGAADGNGLIPSLGTVREEQLCLECHDPSGPATNDLTLDMNKPFRHPTTDYAGLHRADESRAADFDGANRHAECEDCHNPHDVRPEGLRALPPDASSRNLRVPRVSVSNGSAGTQPTYIFRNADDPSPLLEYEICFKCHSNWTTRPAGQDDMALLFNPNNASFHPVEAQGKNINIDPIAFVSGWDATRLTYCGDCHGSGDGLVAGVHGSIHDNLLKGFYAASPQFRPMAPDEACFGCHNYDTYTNDRASDAVLGASRWNRPEESKGHAWHATEENVTCYSCHDSHGSTGNPYLLVFGRSPGLMNWIEEVPNDQYRCYPSCHEDEEYRINYSH